METAWPVQAPLYVGGIKVRKSRAVFLSRGAGWVQPGSGLEQRKEEGEEPQPTSSLSCPLVSAVAVSLLVAA